jgi:hypothetical protein
MASKTFYSPKAPVRYAHLITPDLYKEKWNHSVELILDDNNPPHRAFLVQLEAEFVSLHGAKRRSKNGEPWASLGEGKTRVKFKARRFENTDGTFSKGPKIYDAKKQPWSGADIGNGSEVIIGFTIRDWMDDGAGITLLPKACQVISYVPREDAGEKVAEGFEEQEGYSVATADVYGDEFASNEEVPF